MDKVPSGIEGFDEITLGGLPKGRSTLVYGGPGSGKTVLGLQFLSGGALQCGDPGVFLAFEESIADLKQSLRGLGVDYSDLIKRQLLTIEHAFIDPKEIGRGDYDLDALFMRLARAIDAVKARRLVVDSMEVVIRHDPDRAAVRDSFQRLFRWLGNRGITSIVTAEEGADKRPRHGFEEYLAACVVRLDHRLRNQVSTRMLHVVKYRGSAHGTNEYPFLIDETGICVMPVTSTGLAHRVSTERVSSGLPRLDTMLDGKGFFRATTVMISGTPGAGKSSLAAQYADAACARDERVLVFAYEESPEQILRNMQSIGLNLQRWIDQQRLRCVAARPSMYGLEMHLAVVLKEVKDFDPQSVVIDPITNLVRAGNPNDAQMMVMRLIDMLKTRGITAVLTHPTTDVSAVDPNDLAISSIVDTWILVQTTQTGSEHNRTLYILKSRGMAHSNQVRGLVIGSNGIQLADA